MSLRTRLASLERHVRELHANCSTCPTCNGPSPGYNSVMLGYERDGEVVPKDPTCPAYGLIVNAQGHATASAHRVEGEAMYVSRIIVLEE